MPRQATVLHHHYRAGVIEVGELVGRGRTSDVYAYGAGSVVKVPHADVPDDWPEFEAVLTRSVQEQGVAAPKVRDVVRIEGRSAVVFERIAGPSMWQQMLADPSEAPTLAKQLAAIQKSLLAVGIPPQIPDLVDRLVRKIDLAAGLAAHDRSQAAELATQLPRGAALLHGDLHPGNVLMGSAGPVVIDWFDAAIGHPVADLLRSSILMQPGGAGAPWHLPGANPELLRKVRRTYLNEFRAELDRASASLAQWQAVVAAARLSEGAEINESALVELWAARDDQVSVDGLLSR